MKRIRLFVGGCLLICLPASSQPSPKNREKLRELTATVSDFTRTDLPEKLAEMQSLIREDILRILNSSGVSSDQLDRELHNAMKVENWGPTTSVIHQSLNAIDYIIVSYSLPYQSRALPAFVTSVEAYVKGNQRYSFVARTGESMFNTLTQLETLPSPWSNEWWILAHGQQAQVMQYHEKASIYSFDGKTFKEIWTAPKPIRSGTFRITDDGVLIEFGEENNVSTMVTTLSLTPAGPKEINTLPKKE